ncbi:MAG TPA: methyltransferase domain-containing protein [Chitinophagaceae bacterium]|nr:methyltransferase domain-containing protein [Chitinophagaceae bacterium]
MPDLSQRSYQKELLDQPAIPFEDIKRNMQELEFINRWLGGHKITLRGLKSILKCIPDKENIQVVEIGCGGGDNLKVMKDFFKKRNIRTQLTGIDINPECIEFARSKKENGGINFITSDYRHISFSEKPSIIFSSLFCHHFTDEELIEQWLWMGQNSKHGFFINDLHRNRLAYYSVKCLTRIFSKSYLVKNDAPLSVKRGFRRKEIKKMLESAGLSHSHVHWKWAFRWLIIAKGEFN